MLNGSHLTSAAIGGMVAYVLAKFGWTVSTDEAATFGLAFMVIGGGLAHLFSAPGLIPRVKNALGIGGASSK
jgi:hypothetical protein